MSGQLDVGSAVFFETHEEFMDALEKTNNEWESHVPYNPRDFRRRPGRRRATFAEIVARQSAIESAIGPTWTGGRDYREK